MTKHMRKLSEQDVRDARMLYNIGLSITTIAQHYEVTPSALKYHIDTKDANKNKLPLKKLIKIARLAHAA